MISVNPNISEDQIKISMEVVGKGLPSIVELITQLQSSPAFSDVVFRAERQQDDGSLHASISVVYLPDKVPPTEDVAVDNPAPEPAQPADEESEL